MVSRLGLEPRALALKGLCGRKKHRLDYMTYVDFAKLVEVNSSNGISTTYTTITPLQV